MVTGTFLGVQAMSDTTAAGVPLWYVRQRNRELAFLLARAEAAEAEVERLNGVAAKALAIAEAPDIHGALEALKTALEPNQ